VQLLTSNLENLADHNQAVTLHLYLLTPYSEHFASNKLSGPSTRKQQQAALLSLDLLRRSLQKTAGQ
jgi:hypothetical protein